ncbi:MAG: hypothetical protein J6C23_00840 [Clostridia bacterium]|nr:hypothetical protein [Clostridia bacterium]
MKIIGFADYYISEWHADNYPAWIKQICEEKGLDFEFKYVWAELDKSPKDGITTDEWCEKHGAIKCNSLKELCEKCDHVFVLAPSDPQKHLEYASEVLKYRNNTYIDKTFAPDYATAKKIFDIASEYGTAFFSSSALRYASELDDLRNCNGVITYGGGSNLAEYVIHQAEMAVKVIDKKAKKVRVDKQGKNQYVCAVEFDEGKRATMLFDPSYGFGLCAEKENGASVSRSVNSDFFKYLIADILEFFTSGKLSFDTNQTLEVIRVREGVVKGMEKLGEWIEL